MLETTGLQIDPMDRFAAIRARSRILAYFLPHPHEIANGNQPIAFDRAKAEWLKHASIAIYEVETMSYADFVALRDNFKARKPTECLECGQEFQKANRGGSHD